MPFRVLVVRNDAKVAGATVESLVAGGYHVSNASDFDEAKARVLFAPPDVLITDLRLGAHNGIHLLVYAHSSHPNMPAIVLDQAANKDLEKEVINERGVYVAGGCSDNELVDLVGDLTRGLQPQTSAEVPREYPRKRAEFPVLAGGTQAKVVDVSYSGLRLEMPGFPNDLLGRLIEVDVPMVGTVSVRPIWARGTESMASWWCGVEVAPRDFNVAKAWRKLVDSLD